MRCPVCGSKECCGGDMAADVARLRAENERLRKTLMRIYYFQPDVVFQLETAAEQMRRFAKDALDKRLDAAIAAGGK